MSESNPILSGNEAVERAAEQAKRTAHRNIPLTGELPIPDDTANLRLGPNIHDGLLALLPLVGVWRGAGQADTAEDGEFAFGQEIVFSHDGGNYLRYESRVWKESEAETSDESEKSESAETISRETGFWRINLKDEIEVVAAQAGGVVEIFYGEPLSERAFQLQSASTMVTTTGPGSLGPGKRMYGLMPNNDLGWVEERVVDGELRPHMSAQLQRVAG